MLNRFLFLSLFWLGSSLVATPLQHFSFNLGKAALFRPTGRFFVGADEALPGNTFSVAVFNRGSRESKALTPERVTLNMIPDTANPLNGNALDHLVMLDRRPVVVPRTQPATLFLIDDRGPVVSVFQSDQVRDAQGNQAPSLLALTTSAADLLTELEAGASLAVFAAVPNQAGGFDGNGSGIALAFFTQSLDKKSPFFTWDLVDAQAGVSSLRKVLVATPSKKQSSQALKKNKVLTADEQESLQGNKAAPFGKDTAALILNEPAAQVGKRVALHFDREFGVLYLGVQATSAGSSSAGVRSVIAAKLAQGKVIFQPIAPDNAFQNTQGIVGTRGAGMTAQTFHIRTLHTRTHLRYLVVVGGTGSSSEAARSVFALPLVENFESAAHGTLADVNASPVTLFSDTAPFRFRARVFVTPATSPAGLFSMNSQRARVGGNGQLPGPITDITVATEAVFVSCALDPEDTSNGVAPGIFHSQPVFDVLGRISGWTDWQRVFGESLSIQTFAYDPFKGVFWSIPRALAGTNELFRTEWSDETDPLNIFLGAHFKAGTGGIQSMLDFPVTTPSFSTTQSRLAVQVFGGFNGLVILQTGETVQGLFRPGIDLDDRFTSEDGTLQGFKGAHTLSLAGGALSKLGPITSAAVVTDGKTGWLVVGGTGGVAVLADRQGKGWPAHPGLGSGFVGLTQEHAWHIISTRADIRTLRADEEQLFVLSKNSLERLELTPETIIKGTVHSVVLAEAPSEETILEQSFADFHLKGPLAVLASSTGLFRSGSGADCRTAQNQEQIGWTPVLLSESVGSLHTPGPVTRFFSVASTNPLFEESLYLLNAFVGTSQALMYRLVLTVPAGQVTDSSVVLFPDLILKGPSSFFTNVGDYRNNLFTDGSFIGVTRSSFKRAAPLVELMQPGLRSGEFSLARSRIPFVLLPKNGCTVTGIVRSSASGSWIVTGDFGIRFQK